MNALFLAVIGVAMMLGGYFLYSRYLGSRIYKLNASFRTPAHALEDGVDYVPTNKYVLWGHHFTSVAGAAPIVGPAIAVIWGWVPAFLWVTIGTVFIAGMHDFGALWASGRHRGQSIGTLSGRYIGRNGRNLFLMIIFLLLLMVNAAFAVVIAKLLVSTPTSVIPTWGAIIVALLIGQAIYRLKWNLPPVSLVGVIALYALMVIGNSIPVVLPETILGLNPNGFWIVVLFLYAGVASLLPVWVLLQPRDYINGLQLFVGLIILYGSIALSLPTVVAPTFNTQLPEGTPSMIPLLFVTIACGAISGFHGLVSSGTSSKQIDLETDERFVGYFGAVGEGLLALGPIIATCAGYQTVTQWREVYSAFGKGSVGAFVESGSGIIHAGLGLPSSLSATILATMAVLFAATTMDTGVRLQRLVVQEIGDPSRCEAVQHRRHGHRPRRRTRPDLLLRWRRFRWARHLAPVRHDEPAHGRAHALHPLHHPDPSPSALQGGARPDGLRHGRIRVGPGHPARDVLHRRELDAAHPRPHHPRRRGLGRGRISPRHAGRHEFAGDHRRRVRRSHRGHGRQRHPGAGAVTWPGSVTCESDCVHFPTGWPSSTPARTGRLSDGPRGTRMTCSWCSSWGRRSGCRTPPATTPSNFSR